MLLPFFIRLGKREERDNARRGGGGDERSIEQLFFFFSLIIIFHQTYLLWRIAIKAICRLSLKEKEENKT
jgi:hypothetical protein